MSLNSNPILIANNEDSATNDATYILTTTFLNPVALVAVLVVLFFIGIALYLGGSSGSDPYGSNYNDDDSGVSKTISMILGVIVGILFVLLTTASIAQYVLKIDVVTTMNKFFSDTPEIDIKVTKNKDSTSRATPSVKFTKEVFNIPGNYFSYDDAGAMCNAYDSRLATYKEVEESYNSGAEWCNYGWSEGQMALYPTQQSTWDGLQQIEGHENDCGRPGINGGFMQNKETKFGVNCYGYKPKMTSVEKDIMANTSPYPKTQKDIAMEIRVEYWKKRVNDILVSPFNYTNWSKL
jgi:hypothetical protein